MIDDYPPFLSCAAPGVVSGPADVVPGTLFRQLQRELAQARVQVATLAEAVESNREIGAAIGIVMHRHLLTQDSAFDLLRIVSQRTNRKLREVAREVLETGQVDLKHAHLPAARNGRGRVSV